MDPQPNPKRRGTVSLEHSTGPPAHFYNPQLSVLTIGDGDLSFSMSIAQWVFYKYKKNFKRMVATTYDKFEELQTLYKLNIQTNIERLKKYEAKLVHGIDATKLPQYYEILDKQGHKFDRIVWNFPHSGFPQNNYGPGFQWEEDFNKKHTEPIKCFFKYAQDYLSNQGLILMAHKTLKPFGDWNIPGLAAQAGLKLIQSFPFEMDAYPGYENRRGAGKNGGKRFPIEDARQYVFKKEQ